MMGTPDDTASVDNAERWVIWSCLHRAFRWLYSSVQRASFAVDKSVASVMSVISETASGSE